MLVIRPGVRFIKYKYKYAKTLILNTRYKDGFPESIKYKYTMPIHAHYHYNYYHKLKLYIHILNICYVL